MEDNDSQELRDYKFYCFDGIPKFYIYRKEWKNMKLLESIFFESQVGKGRFIERIISDLIEFLHSLRN